MEKALKIRPFARVQEALLSSDRWFVVQRPMTPRGPLEHPAARRNAWGIAYTTAPDHREGRTQGKGIKLTEVEGKDGGSQASHNSGGGGNAAAAPNGVRRVMALGELAAVRYPGTEDRAARAAIHTDKLTAFIEQEQHQADQGNPSLKNGGKRRSQDRDKTEDSETCNVCLHAAAKVARSGSMAGGSSAYAQLSETRRFRS